MVRLAVNEPSGQLPDGCNVKQTSSTTGSGCSRAPPRNVARSSPNGESQPSLEEIRCKLTAAPPAVTPSCQKQYSRPSKNKSTAQHFPLVNRCLPQLPIHATISKHNALLSMCQSLYTSLLVLREISQCGNQVRTLDSERWPSQTKVPQQVTGRGRV